MPGLVILLVALICGGLVWLYLTNRPDRRATGGDKDSGMSMSRSRARISNIQKASVSFRDVAGEEEAKQELVEIVEFLRSPDKFTALGARIPKGVLLAGPPGTGKTLLARAVAGEANVPFITINGSEFVEIYVGVGAGRVRDLFARAKKLAPCMIFIDEIDAVARRRTMRANGGTEEREQTLNQLLVEMDGFDSNTNIIVIGSTNRPDILDPAITRPGRFDRMVTVDLPDLAGRTAILATHARGKPVAPDVDLGRIARQTAGMSGADLANVMNEAAILAARANLKIIGETELDEAIDRVIAGPSRKSRVISEREKVLTAYHEIGHALCGRVAGGVDPIQKISIVARGKMGGYTRVAGNDDRAYYSRSQLEDYMVFALGGHAAEEAIFGEVTTGPSNDLEKVAQIARSMVTQYGMSKKIGTIAYTTESGNRFLGGGTSARSYSKRTAYDIDQEVHELVQKALARARQTMRDYRPHLVALSEALLERETLTGAEFERIYADPSLETPPNVVNLPMRPRDTTQAAFPRPNSDTPALG